MQTRKGQEIEDESMQIIESEIGSHSYNEMEWPIVRRIIHSTADFDFAGENKLLFHKDAISNGINALRVASSHFVTLDNLQQILESSGDPV